MSVEIDIISDGESYDYDQTVALDGISCVLRMTYNERRDTWSLALSLEDGTTLVSGRTVTLNQDLLKRCAISGRPPGNLIALSWTTDTSTPGLTELGNNARVRLLYIPQDELDA